MNLDSALFIVVAIAVLWFGSRMVMGRRGAGPSLSGMFTREKPLPQSGLGLDAIRTMTADMQAFVQGERAIRGLILAGPFAASLAKPEDPVTFILLADDLTDYRDMLWRARWPYPARGHLFIDHTVEPAGEAIIHRLVLRGAPPVAVHFVPLEAPIAPAATARAMNQGAKVLETGTDAARRALARWEVRKDKEGTS